ncbi:MAG: TonB-dependent receptor [Bacteroidota bacterium]
MKKVLLLSLMFLATMASAQTTVNGKVVDQNNEPIPGANVIVVGTATGTTADFDGNFTLETSETPPFQLRVTSVGYSDDLAEVISNNQNLTIVLEEAQTFLDEVVISASRTPERIFESPVSVERFGIRDIQNSSAASFYDGLENLKGVDINVSSLTFQSLNTRGFAAADNSRFVQLVDGMDNSSPALNFALGNLVGMNELDVQSVEILPGASSALYGANAFNGILFMRSKSPFDFQGISAYVKTGLTSQEAAGDNNYYDFGIRAAHAFNDKLAVKANFSVMQGTDWFAVNDTDLARPGVDRSNPAYDGLNVLGDEVSTTLNFDELFPGGLPSGTLGSALVSRTGYNERDLTDYQAQSVKFDGAIHYRPFADDFEIIYNGRVGRGSTIFHGASRYYIDNFVLQQHKLEVRNDNFFVRGYITSENAGDSYDLRFTGINVNNQWKSNGEWFGDYVGAYIPTFIGTLQSGASRDEAAVAAHAAGRVTADEGRLLPGTPEFQNAFNRVIADGDLTTGSRFIDESQLRHVDANYNFSHLTGDFADIQIGGSFREYELNSQGTIFTDLDGPISYQEFGLYTQVQKQLLDDRLKFTASIRYDKNEFFDGFFSPRVSLGYTAGEKRNHNFRASFQTGFRNPVTQDLFIGLNLGNVILVGSAPDNLDSRTFEITNSATGNSASFLPRDTYENSFTASSVNAFRASNFADPGVLEVSNPGIVQPEQVAAFELGYRGQIGKFTIDLSGYYNTFDDFIATERVFVPYSRDVANDAGDIQQAAIDDVRNGDVQLFQAYTNSRAEVESYGATLGVSTKVLGGFDLGANYTYADFELDETLNPDFRPQFNTPQHKVKASFGHEELFTNFGFNLNYRWSDAFLWQAGYADGDVPAFTVLDAQVNYAVPSIKSVFKVGGSNILADEYFTIVGGGLVGAIYYVSWTINP